MISEEATKALELDEIPSNFLEGGTEILATPLGTLINTMISISNKSRIVKLNTLFKKVLKTDPEITR